MSYRKGVWERFFEEFRNTVDEAHIVKTDLDSMLDKSIGLSRAMVDGIDARLTDLNQLQEEARHTQLLIQQITAKRLALTEVSSMTALPENCEEDYQPDEWLDEQPLKANKIRVYELARELNMNSKELVITLQDLGFPVSNQLNTLDYELSLSIRQKLTLTETDADGIIHQTVEDRVLSIEDYKHNDEQPLDIEALREAHPYLAVRTLQEAGYSICDMAQLLNRGQGEISLIINLINKKKVYA